MEDEWCENEATSAPPSRTFSYPTAGRRGDRLYKTIAVDASANFH